MYDTELGYVDTGVSPILFLQGTNMTCCDLMMRDFAQTIVKVNDRHHLVLLAEQILQENPELIVVTAEVGYGLVPVDAFERQYREAVGRICTNLAACADRVDRVQCGIGTRIK